MNRPTGKLSKLPDVVRARINRKIRDGVQFNTIATWLFAQKAKRKIIDLDLKQGDSYSLIWTRDAKSPEQAFQNCCSSLSQYFHGQYGLWLAEQAQQDESVRLLKYVDELDRAAVNASHSGPSTGINRIIRSLLFDAIGKARNRKNIKPDDLARLANAWARVSGADAVAENTRLRQQDSIDTGLQALYDDVKDHPAALELFNKFRDIVKGSAPQNS
jgi:hypothetical protein